jgi:hypothetical protein
MMLAMVWMTVAMQPTAGAPTDHQTHHASLPISAALSGVMVTAALVVGGVLFTVELVECLRRRRSWGSHTGDAASGAVMSLGMAAMCWLMVTG